MNIYLSTQNNFERNGLGFLTDVLSAYVTEVLNGDYCLDFVYLQNGKLSEYLVEGNYVKCDVGNENYQVFKITSIDKDFTKINVHALHITYNLLDNLVIDSYPKGLSASGFGSKILNDAEIENNFNFFSDITNEATGRYVRKNPIEIIMGKDKNSMINLFGGEIKRDNFNISLLKEIGTKTNYKLMFGKNIKSIKINIDITQLATRILPLGFDGLMLPEKFVDSPIINNYPSPKIKVVEFTDVKYDLNDENAYHTEEEAYEALRNACIELFDAGIDRPTINIKIDWLELSKTKQYFEEYYALEKINLGDTLTAELLGIDFTTKVIKTKYNVLTKTIEKFELGSATQTIMTTINSQNSQIKEVNTSSILEEANKHATNLITTALGGYVYKTQSELFIMDSDKLEIAQKVWRWNINGLGYSSTGINGPYGIAMTMDGRINANFITAGTISANVLKDLTLLLSENNITIDSPNLKVDSLGNLECLNAILRGGNLVLEDDGTGENASIKIKTTKKTTKEVNFETDLNNSYLYQTFGENFDFQEARSNVIFTTDSGYLIKLSKTNLGSSSHTYGIEHKIIITNNKDYSETIYDVIYYTDEDRFDTITNIVEFELPSNFGVVVGLGEAKQYLPYLKKLIIDAGLTTYSSEGMEAKIYSTYKYTRNDVKKVQQYLLGDITLTDAEKSFYDVNGDGQVNLSDFVLIQNNGGKYNISDKEPGKFVIDTTDMNENLYVEDKDGNKIFSLGVEGVKVLTYDNAVLPTNFNEIEVGEALTYRNTESVCGSWINSSSIKRKVIEVNSSEVPSNDYIILDILDPLNNVINIYGSLKNNNAIIPPNFYSNYGWCACWYDTNIGLLLQSSFTELTGYIIVEYI